MIISKKVRYIILVNTFATVKISDRMIMVQLCIIVTKPLLLIVLSRRLYLNMVKKLANDLSLATAILMLLIQCIPVELDKGLIGFWRVSYTNGSGFLELLIVPERKPFCSGTMQSAGWKWCMLTKVFAFNIYYRPIVDPSGDLFSESSWRIFVDLSDFCLTWCFTIA